MTKITFMGAGSTIFVRNIIGDCMMCPALQDAEVALYDIDGERLTESQTILERFNHTLNADRMKITSFCGVENRRAALRGADFVINAIQVGGYEPSTVIDFEIPKKYGLRQTIADTLGIGGIFRALRTAPVMLEFAHDMAEVCPDAWFLNYTNPMAMLTGVMLRGTSIRTVGLCHSVQVCLLGLLGALGMFDEKLYAEKKILPEHYGYHGRIAGINHMAWLLELTKDGKDVYPEIREKARKFVAENRGHLEHPEECGADLVRLEIMLNFGYYVTESSEHNAEYTPYWIKSAYPELIREYGIPLDEYPRRCVKQISDWKAEYAGLKEREVKHTRSREYSAAIMNSILTNEPTQIAGNVLNHGFIENLPGDAVVEVPCLVDASGIQGTWCGRLPVQCAALNMTNVNVQLLAVEAALTGKKDYVYQAAMLDPHTAAELPIDKIRAMCDELIAAHGKMLPEFH